MKDLLAVAWFEICRLRWLLGGLLVVWLGISGLALGVGGLQLQHQTRNAQTWQQAQAESLAQQQAKVARRVRTLTAQGKPLSPDRKTYRNPGVLAQQGTLAVLPAGPMALMSTGRTALDPQAVVVTLAAPALLQTQDNLAHPLQLWLGSVDLVFVLVYLLPLLLIAISFDMTASEQADGTLKLLCIQGGDLIRVVAGKALARIGVLGAALMLLTALSASASFVWQVPFAWGRWAGILVLGFGYGLLWLALALVCNAWRWRTSTCAAVLATIWLASAWLVPGASQAVIQSIASVPPRIRYLQSYRTAAEQARLGSSKLLGRYLEDHPELAGGADNHYALLQLAREQALAQAVKPVLDTYTRQLNRQRHWALGLQFLSPVSTVENALSGLAGSNWRRQAAFRAQVADFQGEWTRYFLPLIQTDRALLPADLARVPHFTFHEPPVDPVPLGWAGVYLSLLSLGLFSAGFWGFRQYRLLDEADR